MAKNQTTRIRRAQVITNNDAFAALKEIQGYSPLNSEYETRFGEALQQSQKNTADTAAQAEAAVKAARDNATAAEWNFHNYMLGVKDQVIAQYGKSSNELQSLGLKKKSEYKSPKRKAAVTA